MHSCICKLFLSKKLRRGFGYPLTTAQFVFIYIEFLLITSPQRPSLIHQAVRRLQQNRQAMQRCT